MRRLIIVLLFSVLALPGASLAQTPSDDTYSDTLQQQESSDPGTESSGPGTAHAAPSVSRGGLPFTGLELGLVVVVATGLVGVGFAIRRAARPGVDDS
jgi:hypothetical protein